VPVHFRSWMGGTKSTRRDMASGDMGRYLDGLPFPFLASVVLGGSAFASASVVHDKRPFIDTLADRLGKWQHPHRALWLSDTYFDRNGVSHVLQAIRKEACDRSLALDFLTCTDKEAQPDEEHLIQGASKLITLPACTTLRLPFYEQQPLRLPDVMAVHQAFAQGGYDRVICSTEAPMGLLALYLRSAFHVPAYFYVHTDWLDFAKRTVGLDEKGVDRLRRLLRAFYSRFDGIFVLNTEQRDFFTSPAMGLSPDRVHLTAHWADATFKPVSGNREKVFPGLVPKAKVLLYAGRLSFEKGLRDLPTILARVKAEHPETVLAIAGTGPAEAWLRQEIPEARFLGWQDKESLARIYSAADLLLLPSWFDTFSCVVLEALQCGLPVLAYASKGPADIIVHGKCGYLSADPEEMASQASNYLMHPEWRTAFRNAALQRSEKYQVGDILQRLMTSVGLQAKSIAGSRMRELSAMPTASWTADGFLAETVGILS
jgi:glycosyltransferase involved in cell wall biosynthesis